MDLGKGKETFAGGITGKAAGSVISDCTVNTGDSLNARIQGGGYVGGITGFQNDTDIFNVHVMGTIGRKRIPGHWGRNRKICLGQNEGGQI